MIFPSLHYLSNVTMLERLTLRSRIRAGRLASALSRRVMFRRMRQVGLHNPLALSSWTQPEELMTLFYLASSCRQGAIALEIGAHTGVSSCYLAAALKPLGGHLYCVDTWSNDAMPDQPRDTFDEFKKNTGPLSDIITTVRKTSTQLETNDVRLPLDLAFIDGDHSYDAVKGDFESISRWMSPTGIIAFHDANVPQHEGISRVIGEALQAGEWMIEGVVEHLLWMRPVGAFRD